MEDHKRFVIRDEDVGLEAYLNSYVHRLEARIEELCTALKPFAELAALIPSNWPNQCRLRIASNLYRKGPLRYEYLAYHNIGDGGKPLAYRHVVLPTIAEWRAAQAAERLEVKQESEASR